MVPALSIASFQFQTIHLGCDGRGPDSRVPEFDELLDRVKFARIFDKATVDVVEPERGASAANSCHALGG